MAFRAVVFDFDGVLAKSMHQHAEAYRRLLAPHGIEVTDEQIYDREGARSESIIEEFLRRSGADPDRETIRRMGDEKQVIFQGLGTPRLYPDARRLFDTVRSTVPLVALVTG
ncbi:MAG: HAD hydrolase-like protein, partial [Euryarchaeota archaeon]|nr:HAD hydrolase-like protein [Euryarchaeota archaeon]